MRSHKLGGSNAFVGMCAIMENSQCFMLIFNIIIINPIVAGWGLIGGNKGRSPYLKHNQLPVMDTKSCVEAFFRVNLQDADKRIR